MPVAEDRLSRRSYLKFAGAAAVTTGIAGCTGGDGGDTPTETHHEDTHSPTPTDTEEPTATPPTDLQVGITMGNMDSGLDPQDHAETNTNIVVRQGYEPVLWRDPEGAIVEGLATQWERLEEGKAAQFTLRDGVTFHNGDPLTAEDVAFSIRRIAFEDVGFASPQAGDLGNPASVEAGDGEVTVRYDPLNPIPFALFSVNGDVMQKSWVEENDRDFINQNLNGTGPFTLSSYDSGNEVVFDRNEDYWGGAAEVGGVTLNASTESSTRVNRLLAEESHIVTNVPPQEVSRVNGSDVASIKAVPSTRVIFLFMKYDVEPFSSQKFRQAMNYAVDVESIIENVLNGFGAPSSQPTLPAFTGHNPDLDPYGYDPDRAEQLVEESGHAGVEITLQTPIGRYLKDVEIAQAAAEQISQLSNVTCDVEQRDFGAYVQDLLVPVEEMEVDFGLLGWGNGEFDASLTISPLLVSDTVLTTYENEEVDSLMEQARGTADPDERDQILQDINAILHEEAPWVFMHQQFSVYGVSNAIDWTPRADEHIDPYRASPN